ncbi:MAG: glycosyltransferase [Hyphomonadaceae bacterium]|nr:glycosyltransferase [Hyphomonadaceae bacterium]
MRICAIGLRGIPDVMGGIETHCENLYPRLASIDTTLDITVIGRSDYVSPGRFGNVRVVSLWAPRRKALETLIHTPLALLYARLFLHPHVVHLHAIGPGFFAPLARLLGFRVLATHHATDYDRPKWGRFGRWFLKTGERMIARFANDVVCVSGTIEAGLAAEYPARKEHYCTIRNGVPPAASTAAPDNILERLGVTSRGYVLAVGRLDATKGFHELVEAFRIAAPAGLKLVIAGGGPEGDGYAAELAKHASPDIIFAGPLPAALVGTLYANAALFVHPSHMEGFALVVLEAIAADAPLLISRIAPHLELALDPECYFETGSVKELSERLATGRFDRLRPALRKEILAEGNWDRIAERHHAILIKRDQPRLRKQRVPAEQESSLPAS